MTTVGKCDVFLSRGCHAERARCHMRITDTPMCARWPTHSSSSMWRKSAHSGCAGIAISPTISIAIERLGILMGERLRLTAYVCCDDA